MPPPTPEQQIQFLVKIQRLLDEGSFVATYKFALLQALADISVEKGDESGDPLEIEIRDIAEKFIQYYSPQSLPYPSPGGIHETLKQNPRQQAEVVGKLTPLVAELGTSILHLKKDKRVWNSLVSSVVRKIREDPLWRLQTLGSVLEDFLYESPRGPSNVSSITLREGVAFNFRQFHVLIVDLVRGAWVRRIRTIRANDRIIGQTRDLHEFLFGSERENLNIHRTFLRDIQSGDCFYCRGRIPGAGDVDHFIPWVKYPVDLGHNFVLAHPNCNRHKGDLLAAEHHLQNWVERNDRQHEAMAQFFDERGIISDLSASNQVTRWAYEQTANAKGYVWVLGDETRELGSYWRTLFPKESANLPRAAE